MRWRPPEWRRRSPAETRERDRRGCEDFRKGDGFRDTDRRALDKEREGNRCLGDGLRGDVFRNGSAGDLNEAT